MSRYSLGEEAQHHADDDEHEAETNKCSDHGRVDGLATALVCGEEHEAETSECSDHGRVFVPT